MGICIIPFNAQWKWGRGRRKMWDEEECCQTVFWKDKDMAIAIMKL